ncbi:hypothetical protein, partial [Lactobacillus gallinarum]|uniref:hypothetical protein n=2 Tax=Bacteria TaxID=2 RepID=UPI0024B9BDE4
RHGVSGVGGSNPLVPTKNPKKKPTLTVGFFISAINSINRPQAFEKHTVTLLPVVNKPVNQQ